MPRFVLLAVKYTQIQQHTDKDTDLDLSSSFSKWLSLAESCRNEHSLLSASKYPNLTALTHAFIPSPYSSGGKGGWTVTCLRMILSSFSSTANVRTSASDSFAHKDCTCFHILSSVQHSTWYMLVFRYTFVEYRRALINTIAKKLITYMEV